MTLVDAGRVGRPHGFDGSFWVEGASDPLALGTVVTLAGAEQTIERRDGTDARPLIRLAGVSDPRAHRGATLLVERDLEAHEWLISDLIGCHVAGLGDVREVLKGPSCDVLEVEGGMLIPLIADAVVEVDTDARLIRVNRAFLGLEESE